MLRTTIALVLLTSGVSAAEEVRRDLYGDPLPAGAVMRLGTVRFRHGPSAIHCISYSPDGKQLASGGEDHLIRLWDARTGAELHRLAGHRATVWALAFSADGKLLASAGDEDGTVRLWDAATGRLLRALQHDKKASFVAFFPDGKSLVTSDDGTKRIHFWAVVSGEHLRTLEAGKKGVDNLALSPNGKWLAAGSQAVRLLDVASGKTVRVLEDWGKWFGVLSFSPDGTRLAAADEVEGWIYLWDVKTGTVVRKVKTPQRIIRALVFTPNGRTLVLATADDFIFRWDVSTIKKPQLLGLSSWKTSSLRVAPDGQTLATAGAENMIRLWNLADGKRLVFVKGHECCIAKMRFADEDKTLLSTSRDDGTARTWNLMTGEELYCEIFWPGGKFASRHFDLSLADRIVAAWTNKTIRLRDLATKKSLAAFETANDVETLSFSRDGTVVAIVTDNDEVEVWDVRAGRRRFRVPGIGYPTLSGDGRWMVTFDTDPNSKLSKRLRLWDVASGEEIAGIPDPVENVYLYPCCFSPDNRMLCCREGRADSQAPEEEYALLVWEVRTGRQRLRLESRRGPIAVAFSPDGRLLAFSEGDGTIRVLEVATGEERARFRGGQGEVYSLEFSNAGHTLASGGEDTTILLWPLPRSEPAHSVRRLSVEELRSLWTELAGEDGSQAFRAMRRLHTAPASTIEFLKAHLRPVHIPDAGRVKRLLVDLGADDFTVREEASRQLEQVTEGAEPLLRQALRREPSLEARRRIKRLLEPLAAQSPDRWRSARVLEVLEWFNTAESRQLLDQLAHGASGAWLTREAKASLHRLDQRVKASP